MISAASDLVLITSVNGFFVDIVLNRRGDDVTVTCPVVSTTGGNVIADPEEAEINFVIPADGNVRKDPDVNFSVIGGKLTVLILVAADDSFIVEDASLVVFSFIVLVSDSKDEEVISLVDESAMVSVEFITGVVEESVTISVEDSVEVEVVIEDDVTPATLKEVEGDDITTSSVIGDFVVNIIEGTSLEVVLYISEVDVVASDLAVNIEEGYCVSFNLVLNAEEEEDDVTPAELKEVGDV